VIGAAAALTAGIAGCAKSDPAGRTSSTSLTIGLASAPISLDPAKAQNSSDGQAYTDLVYAPLITLTSNGSLAPGLAVSWKYTDKALTTFQLSLRPGVKFSDGKPLTATDVIKSIERAQTGAGVAAPYAALIKSMEAPNPSTVVLYLTQSDPTIADVLTQRYLVGSIVGPNGLADPASLGTTPDGAGPYMLDASLTVANSHYTYLPNPNYWDKGAVHFKKITVEVIPNPQTAYNALRSGQVSYVGGSFSTVGEAKSAGFSVYSALSDWYGVFLIDRGGEVVPALAKQQVREALNYAINRPAITTTLFDGYGVPTDEISDSAYADDGYDPTYTTHYTYNPAKAKQLLTQAGYPHGFTITIAATATYGDGTEVAQAIASDWAAIGVKTQIDAAQGTSGLATPLLAKKLPALAMEYDAQPMFLESTQLLDQGAGFFNIFGSADPQLTGLLAAARAATAPAALAADWAAVERQVVDLGWFVPIAIGPEQFYGTKSLKGVDISSRFSSPDPTDFHY
jgi:peptide/nickel transport system substrate-binding protein